MAVQDVGAYYNVDKTHYARNTLIYADTVVVPIDTLLRILVILIYYFYIVNAALNFEPMIGEVYVL